MLIERRSPFSGAVNQMNLSITEEQIRSWQNGTLIQHAMPHLSAGQREFLLTGITEEEWDAMAAEE